MRDDFDNETHRPLGPVVCISPWNFPLAIFTGQIAAALAAGNSVLAKPAEQTPLIAAQGVAILLEAGVPPGVIQLLPGRGETVGAALTSDERVRGVMFTGSTEVATLLQRNIANRLDAQGRPTPLIAETGGMNAMIVDSSALTEQVVIDVLASAFDSAGQRCSALRVLCLQGRSRRPYVNHAARRDERMPDGESGSSDHRYRPGNRRGSQREYRAPYSGRCARKAVMSSGRYVKIAKMPANGITVRSWRQRLSNSRASTN